MSVFIHNFAVGGRAFARSIPGKDRLSARKTEKGFTMAGIYIHIPFCKSKCYYCDFYSCTMLARKDEVLAAIGDELAVRAGFLGGETVRTVYFGGGTPSLLAPEDFAGLLGRIASVYDTALDEVTAEVNPDDVSAAYLRSLRAAGVDRLSIGIQSFIDRDLKRMHRRHDAAAGEQAVRAARTAGFSNLTIDLIYGMPGMSLAEWESNLHRAVALGVPHISAYHLTVEERTVFGRRASRGELREVAPAQSEEQYAALCRILSGAGYRHYEISNFARPGYEAVHNGNYWNGTPYLGVGPSAHSFDGRRREWNVADTVRYLSGAARTDGETISADTAYNEFVMTSLRTARGLDADCLEGRFGARKLQYFTARAARLVEAGVLEREQSVYRIPESRFLVSDAVISDLFYVG